MTDFLPIPAEVEIFGLLAAFAARRDPRHDRDGGDDQTAQSPPAVPLFRATGVRDAGDDRALHRRHRHFLDPDLTMEAR